jgi:5-methylcytosine-specific restriction endonuclease McrA
MATTAYKTVSVEDRTKDSLRKCDVECRVVTRSDGHVLFETELDEPGDVTLFRLCDIITVLVRTVTASNWTLYVTDLLKNAKRHLFNGSNRPNSGIDLPSLRQICLNPDMYLKIPIKKAGANLVLRRVEAFSARIEVVYIKGEIPDTIVLSETQMAKDRRTLERWKNEPEGTQADWESEEEEEEEKDSTLPSPMAATAYKTVSVEDRTKASLRKCDVECRVVTRSDGHVLFETELDEPGDVTLFRLRDIIMVLFRKATAKHWTLYVKDLLKKAKSHLFHGGNRASSVIDLRSLRQIFLNPNMYLKLPIKKVGVDLVLQLVHAFSARIEVAYTKGEIPDTIVLSENQLAKDRQKLERWKNEPEGTQADWESDEEEEEEEPLVNEMEEGDEEEEDSSLPMERHEAQPELKTHADATRTNVRLSHTAFDAAMAEDRRLAQETLDNAVAAAVSKERRLAQEALDTAVAEERRVAQEALDTAVAAAVSKERQLGQDAFATALSDHQKRTTTPPAVTPASAEVERLSRLLRILVQEFRKGRTPVAAGNTKRRKATPKRARGKTPAARAVRARQADPDFIPRETVTEELRWSVFRKQSKGEAEMHRCDHAGCQVEVNESSAVVASDASQTTETQETPDARSVWIGCAECWDTHRPAGYSRVRALGKRGDCWSQAGRAVSWSRCFVCEDDVDYFSAQVGHDVAHALGGSLELSNLQPVCTACNRFMGETRFSEAQQTHQAALAIRKDAEDKAAATLCVCKDRNIRHTLRARSGDNWYLDLNHGLELVALIRADLGNCDISWISAAPPLADSPSCLLDVCKLVQDARSIRSDIMAVALDIQ